MDKERQLIIKTERMIDDLKAVCGEYGLSNTGNEYKIIADSFLYKYLNDKFLYEFKKVDKNLNEKSTPKEVEEEIMKLSPSEMSKYRYGLGANVAYIRKEFLVSYLFNNKNSTTPKFYELFDNALDGISNDNIDIFSVRTGSKEKIKLFSPISQYIIESTKKNDFSKAIIDKLVEFSFDEVFEEKYDFFSTIFEYLIKDYNKDFGKYAEYYTPNSIARIIAKIMIPDTNKVRNVSIYDPSAGSGTLLLALAHEIGEEDCTLYTQDISQKSNEFLRLNLILNNLVHSLDNVVHDNTLLNPAHLNKEKNKLATFDYIVSNPPFKTDFSDYRDKLEDDKYSERFFAGVPEIPKIEKDKMPIYLLFIQHILYSLKENGKAAIVVPTIFLTTEQGKIEQKIRKHLIDNKMLRKVISMPSNIFANTGTNVSVLFIEKNNQNENVLLVDATRIGKKIKDGKLQRTILENDDINHLVDMCINNIEIEKKSIIKTFDEIKNKNYMLSAGQYFSDDKKRKFVESNEYSKRIDVNSYKFNNCFSFNKNIETIIDIMFEYWFMQFDFPDIDGNPYKSSGGKMVFNELLKKDIPVGWDAKPLSELLSKIPVTKKYKTSEYLDNGEYPIIDQSERFIAGYTNEEEDVLNIDNCIVFGDHTKILKYVNFDFARGADGTQIIASNNENLSNFILYLQLKQFNLVSQGYSRYFKFLKEKIIIIPTKEICNEFISKVENKYKEFYTKFNSLHEENFFEFILPTFFNNKK